MKRIAALLLVISLCAVSVSCARQPGQEPQPLREPTALMWLTRPSAAWPKTPQTEAAEPESSTEESTAQTQPPTTRRPQKKRDPLAAFEEQALELTNLAREQAGLAPLEFSEELRRCARIRAVEIVQSFSHDRPDGQSCFSLNPELILGENIAYGQTSPRQVVDAWMNSPSHREIILLDYLTVSAVGCYYDKTDDTYYWVQLFGCAEPEESTTADF